MHPFFNVSPAINKILISGYTQRPDKEGSIKDDYIYSIKFVRDVVEHIFSFQNCYLRHTPI